MREALDVALEHDLVEAALRAYNNLAGVESDADRPAEAKRLIADAFDLAQRRGHRHYLTSFAAWQCLFLLFDGDWDEAFALADELIPAQPTANGIIVFAHNWLAAAALERGNADEARRRFDLVAPELETSTDLQLRSAGLMRLVLMATEERRPDDALRSARLLMENELEQGNPFGAAATLKLAPTVAQDHGRVAALAELTALVDAVPELGRMRDLVASISRAQGLVAADRGDEDGAVEAFSAGLAAARNLGERWLLAELLADYGRFLVSVGRFDDAEPLLDEAQQLWEGTGAVRWLERIEAARSPSKVTA